MKKRLCYLFIAILVFLGINQNTEIGHHLQQFTSSETMVSAVKDVDQVKVAHITTAFTVLDHQQLEKVSALPPILSGKIMWVKQLTSDILYPDRESVTWHVDMKKYHSNYLSYSSYITQAL